MGTDGGWERKALSAPRASRVSMQAESAIGVTQAKMISDMR